jgi:PIN domain nuclease of toxin-antitoxin system
MVLAFLRKELGMSTVDEIIAAASKLSANQLVALRRRLDRLEKRNWESELTAVTAEMKRRKITDDEIDRKVTRRRRESRS